MCGIFVSTQPNTHLTSLVKKRGPDYFNSVSISTSFGSLILESSVLSLREPFTKQPLNFEDKWLCFNGQIYDIEGNDSQWFLERFLANGPTTDIEGEYAFAYFDGAAIWFGRDKIGRRSLLFDVESGITVCSLGAKGFIECQAGVLYRYEGGLKEMSSPAVIPVQQLGIPASLDEFTAILKQAVKSRMVMPSSNQGSIAVLFSGGLDCTLLTRLMDIVLPPDVSIELLNVAFENKRTNAQFDTPDRKLGIRSHAELKALTDRDIKLIKIDVPYDEATGHYSLVRELMYPKETVMDLSIAIAFFFASKATAESKSRILISGLGADELFGGYSRHTRAAEQGPEALAAELELDFNRLGSRNLGRDDRVCCYWGKEVRYPFLDSRVVNYAVKVDLTVKADKSDTKILLRQVASSLGLTNVCQEKKRAIQFGAKSAKMDPNSGRSKGTDML